MTANEVAIVVGAGQGLGAALCRRFVKAGMLVAAATRDKGARDGGRQGGRRPRLWLRCRRREVRARSLRRREARLRRARPWSSTTPAPICRSRSSIPRPRSSSAAGASAASAASWSAARPPAPWRRKGRGRILFTGATASLRGGANFVNLAVGKFGLRALAQSMARELGPKGVHVAHVIIDGQIAAEHRPGRSAAGARAGRHAERRFDCRGLLAAAQPTAQRLDAGDGPAALGGEVLAAAVRSPFVHAASTDRQADLAHHRGDGRRQRGRRRQCRGRRRRDRRR